MTHTHGLQTGIVSTNGEDWETHWAVYDCRQRWNGFLAAPALDALSVVEMLDPLRDDASYGLSYDFREDGALVITEYQMRDEEGEAYEPLVTLPDEDGLYMLGSFGWVWTEGENEGEDGYWPDAERVAYLLSMGVTA